MANEFYTLIVVPHAKARFRRLQVSVKFIKWAGAISATLALLLLISLVHYARIAVAPFTEPLGAEAAPKARS